MQSRTPRFVISSFFQVQKRIGVRSLTARYFSDVQQKNPVLMTNIDQPSTQNADLWAWIPPRDKLEQHNMKANYQLPVVIGWDLLLWRKILVYFHFSQLPTTDEVAEYLKSNGAHDVMVIALKDPLMNIKHMVICSASSTRLLRQFAETISENVRCIENSLTMYI